VTGQRLPYSASRSGTGPPIPHPHHHCPPAPAAANPGISPLSAAQHQFLLRAGAAESLGIAGESPLR